QMRQDLLQARNLLNPEYQTIGKFRANKYVATALLARLCLYEENWKDDEQYSTEVIESDLYILPGIDVAFLKESTEAIWQLMTDGQTFNTREASSFVPLEVGPALPSYPLTTNLLTAFEIGDQRYNQWVGSKTVNETTHYFPYKYKIRGTAVDEKIE